MCFLKAIGKKNSVRKQIHILSHQLVAASGFSYFSVFSQRIVEKSGKWVFLCNKSKKINKRDKASL